jgi:tetratricopeptide (TPR) repeat protein
MQFQKESQDRLTTEMVQRVFDNVRNEFLKHMEKGQIYQEAWIGSYYYRYLSFLADYLKQAGRISDSISVYKSIIELLGPTGTDSMPAEDLAIIYNEWSVSLLNLKRFGEAENISHKAIEILPNDPGILHNMGLILFNKGEIKPAEEYFLRVLAIEETDLALYMMGRVKESLGQQDKSFEYYHKSLRITRKPNLRKEIETRLEAIRSNGTQ